MHVMLKMLSVDWMAQRFPDPASVSRCHTAGADEEDTTRLEETDAMDHHLTDTGMHPEVDTMTGRMAMIGE